MYWVNMNEKIKVNDIVAKILFLISVYETKFYITLYVINIICQVTDLDVFTFNKEVIMMH